MRTDTEKLQRRNQELATLNAIADALNRSTDLNQMLQAALALVAQLLDLQTGWVFLLDTETGAPYLAAAQNLPPGLANAPQRFEGHCYCLDTYAAGDLNGAANVNIVTCSRLKWLERGTAGLKYHASIPLYAAGKKLGVMNVASQDWRELEADDLQLLYTIGDFLGIAIERARLFAQSIELGATEERNRLAREIHDTLAQGLAGVSLQLETADALLEAEQGAARVHTLVRQALSGIRACLADTRRSVSDLRALPLKGRHLADALRALAADTRSKWKLNVRFATSGRLPSLPERIEGGLYRIAQEALNNAVRHAAATHAQLRLDALPRAVELSITDDGKGFDPSQLPEGRYGLMGMTERARLLGGSLNIDSRPGGGTRIVVTVPEAELLTQAALMADHQNGGDD